MADLEGRVKASGIPLTSLPYGKRGIVVDIGGGRGLRMNLSSIGIVPKETIKKLNYNPGGPQICLIKGTRLSIGYGMASRIHVRPYKK